MTTSSDPVLSKSEFWWRVASWSFALWSLMLGVVGMLVRDAASSIVESQSKLTAQFETSREAYEQYRLVTEKRILLLEDRQNRILQRLDRLEGP